MDILKKGCSSLRTWKESEARLHRVLASLASKCLLAGGSGASEADASTSSPPAIPRHTFCGGGRAEFQRPVRTGGGGVVGREVGLPGGGWDSG